MAIRDLHLHDVASLRDAGVLLVIDHRTALRLYGVIKIKPLRGFFLVKADNHLNSPISVVVFWYAGILACDNYSCDSC